jgi:hypothetical protein
MILYIITAVCSQPHLISILWRVGIWYRVTVPWDIVVRSMATHVPVSPECWDSQLLSPMSDFSLVLSCGRAGLVWAFPAPEYIRHTDSIWEKLQTNQKVATVYMSAAEPHSKWGLTRSLIASLTETGLKGANWWETLGFIDLVMGRRLPPVGSR